MNNKKKYDAIWNYFHDNSEKTKYICNVCETSYKTTTSISSMKRHFKNHHMEEYKEMEMKNKTKKIKRKTKNRSRKISNKKEEKKNSIVINYNINNEQLKEEKYSQVILKNVIIDNINFLKQRVQFKSIDFTT
ncbi:16569_t:CDS:1 [Cetraspora pellucida]|uniref:16569_t:CDS:1 n=1 Tax=Cetraspora pellucida TaxID=1433469 RepID=A0A9N9KAM3_9GLOM|nr:16569_t:CDS:1 [Cetraspora pellucida]